MTMNDVVVLDISTRGFLPCLALHTVDHKVIDNTYNIGKLKLIIEGWELKFNTRPLFAFLARSKWMARIDFITFQYSTHRLYLLASPIVKRERKSTTSKEQLIFVITRIKLVFTRRNPIPPSPLYYLLTNPAHLLTLSLPRPYQRHPSYHHNSL